MAGDFRASMSRPQGTLIITPEFGATITADTFTCPHCQAICVVQRGSGRRRGFCMKCMKPTCGCQACDTCVPFEKKLELYEKGKLRSL